jgi:hypothetical protein
MEKLVNYSKNKFYYELVVRQGNFGIFRQRLEPGKGCLAYEVIHIRFREETILFDKVWPATEYAPSNEEWGSHGWTLPTLEAAQNKLKELVEKEKNEQDNKNKRL